MVSWGWHAQLGWLFDPAHLGHSLAISLQAAAHVLSKFRQNFSCSSPCVQPGVVTLEKSLESCGRDKTHYYDFLLSVMTVEPCPDKTS